jgi:hypothetical protein
MADTGPRLALMRRSPRRCDLDHSFALFRDPLPPAADAGAEIFIIPKCWLDGYAAADGTSTPTRLQEIAESPGDSPYLQEVDRATRD